MIISIKVLEDNYTHFIYTNKVAIAFDCVEPKYVLKLLNKDISKFNKISISKEEIDNLPDLLNPRKLIGFFTTHKHLDHSAGDIFLSKYSKHFKLNNNEIIKLDEWNIKGITTPCHTLDSICFYITCNNSIPIIITGDTLFMLGCGKFFEGTPEMMFNNFRILEKLEGIVLY